MLTHNVTALLFLPALVVLGLLLQTQHGGRAAAHADPSDRRHWVWGWR